MGGENIASLSYPDFVGFINQWNVPPGAHNTVTKWKTFGEVKAESRVLEVACTTGFSSRELALTAECSGVGFDISAQAIDRARLNRRLYAPEIDVDYCVADGYAFEAERPFSHVILGAALQFFPDPRRMLGRCLQFLRDPGILLASPFYIETPIPRDLVERFEGVFGMTPTLAPYKDIMKMYEGLEILYEERNSLVMETESEIQHYCTSTIDRVYELGLVSDQGLYTEMHQRLADIRRVSNELRRHQAYSVLVLRHRSTVFPRRYVELF